MESGIHVFHVAQVYGICPPLFKYQEGNPIAVAAGEDVVPSSTL
nr:hypothetical protein [Escherichia coli]